jgi:hypothetical protein
MHLSDADLLLHRTGDLVPDPRVTAHLASCPRCRAALDAVGDVLATFDERDLPVRGPDYGDRVWRAIEGRLAAPEARVSAFRPRTRGWLPPLAYAASVAALLAVTFGAPAAPTRLPESQPAAGDGGQAAGDRILAMAVADHFDRTSRMLVELNNAEAGPDIDAALASAEDLASATRLYRDAAAQAGDVELVSLLDGLERVLVDVAHDDEAPTADSLERLRDRFDTREVAHRLQLAQSTFD